MGQPMYKVGIRDDKVVELIYDTELIKRLNSFMDRYPQWRARNISRDMQRHFGKMIDQQGRRMSLGLGETRLKQFLGREFNSSQSALDNLQRKIKSWLDEKEQVLKIQGKIRENYGSYKRIKWGMKQAYESRQFVAIVGPSGIGKTTAAKDYLTRFTNGDFILVEPFDRITGLAFLRKLCESLALDMKGSTDAILDMLRSYLREFPKILVIDESDFLPEASLNHLVYIWNGSDIGVVLLGTRKLDDILKRHALERIKTRLKVTIYLDHPTADEIAGIMQEVFGRDADEDAIKCMQVYASNYRVFDTVMAMAKEAYARNRKHSLADVIKRVGPRVVGKKI